MDSTDPENVLEVVGLHKEYPGTPPVLALRGVSFAVKEGELVSVVGPSGSGKSTLLHLMGTLDRPTSGEVTVAGFPVSELSDRDLSSLRAHHIGFVFQQFHLLEGMNAVDNVALGLLHRGSKASQRRARAAEALERVGLSNRSTHNPSQLSGGERQRVAIARAIVGEPALVLADEPTGNLDSVTSAEITTLLRDLNASGTTIIVVTHNGELAATMGHRVALHDGRISQDRRPVEGQFAPSTVNAETTR